MARPTAAAPTPRPKQLTKAIEDVKVGDWVLAKDPAQAGPPTPHRVTALPRNWTQHVVRVRVEGSGGGGEVLATREHPFFTLSRGWVKTKDLRPYDRLVDERGRPVTVVSVEVQDRTCDTFNLTVDQFHTYYVVAGDVAILVHNLNPWDFGNYEDMIGKSRGDGLDIHHYPQGQPASDVIPGYNYQQGLAVAVPHDEHMGMNGTNYRAGEYTGDAKGLIDEAKQNMHRTSIPPDKLQKLDDEARRRYLPPCK